MFEAARANQNGVDVNNIASIAFDLDFHDKISDEPFRFGQSTSHPSDPTTMWVRYSIPSNNCVRLAEGSCLGSPAVTHEQCTRIADAAVANVVRRARDQFRDVVMMLVTERTHKLRNLGCGRRRILEDLLQLRQRRCQGFNKRIATLTKCHATLEVLE